MIKLLTGILLMLPFFTFATELVPGRTAPDFSLSDAAGAQHTLADYRGKWVVLYFYPKDDTPGCTKEACFFRDDSAKFRAANAEVIGISTDSKESHAEFAKKFSLNFTLLSDPDGEVAKSYGALWSLGPIKIAKRRTFLIDPDSKIAKTYLDVDVSVHSQQIIGDLDELNRDLAL